MLTALSLFSGIGGFEVAAASVGGFKCQQLVEVNLDAQKVLSHHFPNIPIHADIRTFSAKPNQFKVVWGGFPCSGTSDAGKREGLNNKESNLWFEYLRIIQESQPRFVVIEQPEGVINRGLRAILGGLRMVGYSWDNPQLVSASWLGAPHRRNRLFIIAYPNDLSSMFNGATSWEQQIREEIEAIANPNSKQRRSDRGQEKRRQSASQGIEAITNAPSEGRKRSSGNSQQQHYSANPTPLEGRRGDEQSSAGLDDGVPGWLDGISFSGWWANNPPPQQAGVSKGTKGRRSCVSRYGLSVTPQQAAIALKRVKYLNSLLSVVPF